MNNFFIGIDFSKKKFDAVILTRQDLSADGVHAIFDNTAAGCKLFARWLKKQTHLPDGEGMLICGENTGLYSLLVSDFLYCSGFHLWIENGLQIKRSSGLRRGKDDHSDARIIAEYCARYEDKARLYKPEGEEIRALKHLFTLHRMLVKHKGDYERCMGEMRATIKEDSYLKETLCVYTRLIAELKKQIVEVTKRMLEIIKRTEALMKTYTIVNSMKGIGPINSVALIVATNNFKKFDYNPRKMASHWGIAPFRKQSGTSLDGSPHVSHYANLYLKSLLSEAVVCAITYCKPIREYYLRLLAKNKNKAIVLNNCKNKMLHILVTMVKNNTPFTTDPEKMTLSLK